MSTTLTIAASADKNAQLDLFSPTSGPPIVGVVVTLNRPCAHCGDTTVTVGSSAGPHHARLNCIGCGAGWLPRSQYRALVNAPGFVTGTSTFAPGAYP